MRNRFTSETIQGKLSNLLNPVLEFFGLILMPYRKIDQTKEILEQLCNSLIANKAEPEWNWGNVEVRGVRDGN